MKVVIARLNHETNTFSPVPTPLAAFGAGDPRGPAFGAAAYAAGRDSATAMGAFIDLAERRGCAIETALFAMANPSACTHRPVFAPLATAIIECASAGVCSSDFSRYRYDKVRRPIYPPDPVQNLKNRR